MSYKIQSVERCFAILSTISHEGKAMRLDALAAATGLPKPTVYRFLAVLEELGYLQRGPDGSHSIGYELFRLGAADEFAPIRWAARPILSHLADQTGETVHLAYLEGTDIVCLDKVESDQTLRIDSEIGMRLDAHATGLGKALLAYLPENDLLARYRNKILPSHTKRTIVSMRTLQHALAQIRRTGIAFDEEEMYSGVRCVAAPIIDHVGKPMCAISVAGPSVRIRPDGLRLSALLTVAAREISAALDRPQSRRSAEQATVSVARPVSEKVRNAPDA